jgi:energy-coupling factor transporter ATP-binding protein EcfA2
LRGLRWRRRVRSLPRRKSRHATDALHKLTRNSRRTVKKVSISTACPCVPKRPDDGGSAGFRVAFRWSMRQCRPLSRPRPMSLIALRDVRYGIGGPDLLLEDVQWSLEPGERVCVVGRNGAGKSTLMKLLAGEMRPTMAIVLASGVVVARLAQEVPQDTAWQRVRCGAVGRSATLGALPGEFHRTEPCLARCAEPGMRAMAVVQARIDALQGWDLDRRVTEVLQPLEPAGRRRVRVAVRWHEAARAAGARAGAGQPRCAAAGRAHQPPRHRCHRLAGGVPRTVSKAAWFRHPRPPLPARAGHAHRRDRPGPADQLARRLRQLPAPARGAPACGGAGQCVVRQETGPGRSLDPPGHQGAAHPQRRPRARARRPCAGTQQRRASRPGAVQLAVADPASGKQGDRGPRPRIRHRRAHADPRISRPPSSAAIASA